MSMTKVPDRPLHAHVEMALYAGMFPAFGLTSCGALWSRAQNIAAPVYRLLYLMWDVEGAKTVKETRQSTALILRLR